MSHQLLVLHFGMQRPWQPWVAEQAREAAKRLGGRVDIVDVSQRSDLAEHYRLFFPFVTVINGIAQLPSPTRAEELVRIAVDGFTPPPLTPILIQTEARIETIKPLIAANIGDTCHLCIRPEENRGCLSKASWAYHISRHVQGGILGFAAYHDDRAVGVVEFLPSELVPYPIPEKSPVVAFITCLYSLENGSDYRGQVLEYLVDHLQGTAYHELHIIAGRHTPYPNGPEAFFHPYGFNSMCELRESH